ncbi:MAG: TIGR01244 family phosphatase [Betaproteobacteria bacterium]|jgi:sulfide:quinone oxidoreductase|nr:TIGR01244 family phosphatase [Betaproteobacteria bacterium]
MIEIKTLSPEIGVAGQVAIDDLPAIAAAGYRSVLCNRPDHEGTDQPTFQQIEQAALVCGLEARYLPVSSGGVTSADGLAFARLLDVLPRPVLAYCRSGARSTTLWNLAQDIERARGLGDE